jgi:hypothetical protein
VTQPELRAKLIEFIDHILDRMLEFDTIEPSFLSLIAGAHVAVEALDRRQQPKEAA